MIWILVAAGLLIAVVVSLVVLFTTLRRNDRAQGSVDMRGGVDIESGQLGTGSQKFAKQPYPTVVVRDGSAPPAPARWQIDFRDSSGSLFSFTFAEQLVMGRAAPGQYDGEVAGIGTDFSVSHHQCQLYVTQGQLCIRNLSPKVMMLCNGQPLQRPVALQPGCSLQAGRVQLTVLQIGQIHA